jgi:hypothetical protein
LEKLKKHLASIIVFGINLILMGVGFLFIKNSDEAKKSNLADENTTEGTLTESEVTAENVVQIPAEEKSVDIVPQKIASDTKNIPSSTAPVVAQPKATTNNTTKTTAPTPANISTKNTSTNKSSATTKTS